MPKSGPGSYLGDIPIPEQRAADEESNTASVDIGVIRVFNRGRSERKLIGRSADQRYRLRKSPAFVLDVAAMCSVDNARICPKGERCTRAGRVKENNCWKRRPAELRWRPRPAIEEACLKITVCDDVRSVRRRRDGGNCDGDEECIE